MLWDVWEAEKSKRYRLEQLKELDRRIAEKDYRYPETEWGLMEERRRLLGM